MILIKVLRLLVLALLAYGATGVALSLRADGCPTYTNDQLALLRMAKAIGEPHGLGLTLMAITEQESFWCEPGKPVCRINESDGDYGAYGVTQIELRTGLYLLGWDNTPENRIILSFQLITVDSLSMDLSVMKLQRHEHKGWFKMVEAYNGRGADAEQYAVEVSRRTDVMARCAVGDG